jgi:hypothetical protein
MCCIQTIWKAILVNETYSFIFKKLWFAHYFSIKKQVYKPLINPNKINPGFIITLYLLEFLEII